MDTIYTIVAKFGERLIAKRCSADFSRDELLDYIVSKWSGITKTNVVLTYDLHGSGEIDIFNDEDMSTMFCILDDIGSKRVNVMVRRTTGNSVSADEVVRSDPMNEDLEVNSDNDEFVNNEGDELVGQKLWSDEWRNLIKGPGQFFPGGAVEFRKALILYSSMVGFEYKYLKNDRGRVAAECKLKNESGCKWRIHASIDSIDKGFYIRTYERNHICGAGLGAPCMKRLNSKIIVDMIVDDIRAMPTMSHVQVMAMVKKNYGVDIKYCVAWKSTDKGKSAVFGDHSTSFVILRLYLAELERTNLRSHVHLDVDDSNKFKRCFFAFAASLLGFKHCRPMIMIDGTFLKGRHKGVLLSAVAKDGDEGLFPIAFAVVNEETNDNWYYFFEHLKIAIGADRKIVFISDRGPGIINGVKNLFPDSPHAHCFIHLKRNIESRFRGAKTTRPVMVKLFSKMAYASTKKVFHKYYVQFIDKGGRAAEDFLNDSPKEVWANAFFVGNRYGQMTSNASELWNAQIRDERLLPVVSLIDGIRTLLMEQMSERRMQASRWPTKLCKSIENEMRARLDKSRGWEVKKSTDDIWQVFSTPNAVVDIRQKTCTCRWWQMPGLPCSHAASIIFLKLNGRYDLVDQYFTTESYKEAYDNAIIPFPKPDVKDVEGDVVSPPDYHQPRGRPKRKRISSQGEKRPIKCGRCGIISHHNKQTCRMNSHT